MSAMCGCNLYFTITDYDVETCPRCVDAIREVEKIETPDLYDDGIN